MVPIAPASRLVGMDLIKEVLFEANEDRLRALDVLQDCDGVDQKQRLALAPVITLCEENDTHIFTVGHHLSVIILYIG